MAHKVIILYRLYMPYYFLGTFTEYPYIKPEMEVVDLESCYDILAASDRNMNVDFAEAEEAEDGTYFDTKNRNTWGDIW